MINSVYPSVVTLLYDNKYHSNIYPYKKINLRSIVPVCVYMWFMIKNESSVFMVLIFEDKYPPFFV